MKAQLNLDRISLILILLRRSAEGLAPNPAATGIYLTSSWSQSKKTLNRVKKKTRADIKALEVIMGPNKAHLTPLRQPCFLQVGGSIEG